jgi:hypothetical protein
VAPEELLALVEEQLPQVLFNLKRRLRHDCVGVLDDAWI